MTWVPGLSGLWAERPAMDKQPVDMQPVDRLLDVRQAVLADLDDLAALFDGYRRTTLWRSISTRCAV